MKFIYLGVVIAAFLFGWSKMTSGIPAGFNEDLSHAAKLKTSIEAYIYIKAAAANLEVKSGKSFSDYAKAGTKGGDELWLAQHRYLLNAVEQMNPIAISALYSNDPETYSRFSNNETIDRMQELINDKRKKFASRVVELAKTSDDAIILRVAARILDEGTYYFRDAITANAYRTKVWLSGDIMVADKISITYNSIRDIKNTYLWALRCVGECDRTLNLSEIERNLTTEEIKKIQRLAADKSVSQVNI